MELIDALNPNPPLSHRFGVFFFAGGSIPNPIDFRFQKVSGINTEIQTSTIREGGQNLYTHRLPEHVNYSNLVLDRGYATVSPLVAEFNQTFSQFKFYPSNVLVTLFNESGVPLGAWLYFKAYPVKWAISELDAQSNTVLIEKMELAYTRFQTVRI
ncbi:phage tail protein [Fulvivirga sediminis]|uniref:Phage tail protein n=1 Tax=Fulvivirga sediminis TaxID=2803949 RepID=A0A937K0H0_9BACT|nr:phage tail protein [Fulvivirga sediminis]MBL3655542.1 phage tail protein [Fulvivirga sediminis]